MCFMIPNHDKSKEYTAKEDITVYKVIFKDNSSQYRYFQYKPNTTYRLRKKLKIINVKFIYEGFHSYIDKKNNKHMVVGNSHKIVKFVIPKGAKYYINKMNGEYVSTSIRTGDLTALYLK